MFEKSVVERLIERAEKIERLVSNCGYISWLENFTLAHGIFKDYSWLYTPEEISKEDFEKVQDLELFFEGIKRYCDKYYINTEISDGFEQECIHIKHNNVGYQIGLVVGQGAYVYVVREEPKADAIDFNDVLSDTKPKDFESKENLLKKFESAIYEMKNVGFSKTLLTVIMEKCFKQD